MAVSQTPRSPLLELNDLRMHFPIRKGAFRHVVGHVKAVDGVSLRVEDGETLGIVGESGCGKSTLARTVLRIYKPTSGEIRYRDRSGGTVDLAALSGPALDEIHRDLRMVFQDPQSSLNPRLPVIDIIGEVLSVNGIVKGRELEHRVADLMLSVGLRPEYMRRYPHAFSGGERQRIGIARALASNPRLVIADEAVSALDVSVQAQTINLLQDLQEQFGLTYLFVAHDLSVVRHISDNIAVMYVGRVVEKAPTELIFSRPLHPYTEALLSAVPIADPRLRRHGTRIRLAGEVADPAHPPPGCPFHPRCRYATELCRQELPVLRTITADGHAAACHHAESLSLNPFADRTVPEFN
ncbi:peptide/nickel transport system ATP-binding protein [Neorhizobium sp. 2083]|uniref:ABC transporter ATP-binding protein n=1 Tax=Neorhizobium sp. 2083 TaxID=2817762 RepID=UPI00285C4600|nr:oligopeptide/dipeptide ABC transporter ATP-binding protein [Neorhizobium sp. 2083]MDR6820179.1 peptide/nickel transport system ATP-binding protein [Neorhizobium sp. 2083]